MQHLRVLFVGPAIPEVSDELGFYYLTPKNRFWSMLEYAALTPTFVVSPSERHVLENARRDGVLNEMYKKIFFEKKEDLLLKLRIGLTDLNRRRVYAAEDDRAAEPTPEDAAKLVKKVEKYGPKAVAFVTKPETFERALKPLYPSATRQRGRQDFLIGASEVWLLGSTNGRLKDTPEMEELFEALAASVGPPEAGGA